MAVWNSSSLAFSNGGHELTRHKSGLLKNLSSRISKQHLTEEKLFGSNRGKTGKSLKIGKKFKGVGKGILKTMKHSKSDGAPKSSGISPSIPEFDSWMKKVTSSNSSNHFEKKPKINRKMFG